MVTFLLGMFTALVLLIVFRRSILRGLDRLTAYVERLDQRVEAKTVEVAGKKAGRRWKRWDQ